MPHRSSNGWTASDRSVIASYSLPGGRVALRKGDVSVILLWCANRWHETVEPLRWPGVWGFADRMVRGSDTTISDHASGTAIDINAPAHPLGVPVAKTFTPRQVRAIYAILEYCEDVVGWGGDYRKRPDGMHLFIRDNAAEVRRIADKIRAQTERAQARQPALAKSLQSLAPQFPSREDTMLIKSQPNKTKPEYVAALLSGFNFVGLGPTETPTDEQAKAAGIPVLWVEYGTYQELDRRSHAVCDNPRPVVTQSPVVRTPPPTTTNVTARMSEHVTSSPNSPSPTS